MGRVGEPILLDSKWSKTPMDVEAYLKRINYHGKATPNPQTLCDLHIAHLLSVPFENLDIRLGRPILMDESAIFDKIVTRRRGGFCYELNGLFASLLRELGFKVDMLSASMAAPEGGFNQEFDHMALLVTLDQRWLADVGSGDSFREPLLLDTTDEQLQNGRVYGISQDNDQWFFRQCLDGGDWKARYRFSLQPHQLSDFNEMCRFHQTSPLSHFTQQRVVSLATPNGRLTLSDMNLIATTLDGCRQERSIANDEEYNRVLRERFGIVI